MRYALGIEYDGRGFLGWQAQKQTPTVQATLEAALSKVANETVRVVCAGRTDTGVHARCQVVHFDADAERSERSWILGANSNLPDTVSVLWAKPVGEEFHARFSALGRRYVYRIISRRAPLTVERHRAWNVKIPLDVEAMDSAAKILLGEHDFTTFRSTECQAKSPVKTLDTLDVKTHSRHGLDVIEITTTARSFLHNQVRSIAGCLKAVGEGKWDADDLAAALDARDRTACAPVAPAHGLYLVSVSY